MGALGDVYLLTDVQTLLGQMVLNTYFYRIEDTPSAGAATGLATEFISDVLTPMLGYQSPNLHHDLVRVVNIFDTSDATEVTVNADGTASLTGTQTAPSFISMAFKFHRGNTRTRHGHKSIAGLRESDFIGNVLETAIAASATAVLCPAFGAQLVAGGIDTFTPVIVARIKVSKPGTVPLQYKYRLPEGQDEMGDRWSEVNHVSLNGLSTMNSRKAGHGA